MRKYLSLLSVVLTLSCSVRPELSYEVRTMLKELDRTLDDRDMIAERKQHQIDAIKAKLVSGLSDYGVYSVYDELFDEYYQYNLDSAITYARKKQAVAARTGCPRIICDARLDLADRYVLSGMYVETFRLMDEMDIDSLDVSLHPRYYHIYNTLFDGLEDVSDDPELRREYAVEKEYYRQKLYGTLGEDDISSLYLFSEKMLEDGRADEILQKLTDKYLSADITIHQKAILSYIIGNVYISTGETDKAIYHYAESAIYDLRTPVNEYRSLAELSWLLYNAGDISRAYRYITRSVDDAAKANARISKQSIDRLLPVISSSYEIQMKLKRRQLNYLLSGISLLAVLLIIATAVSIKGVRRLSAAQRRMKENNLELQNVNKMLKEYVLQLQEANSIKESYLGRYLDMCSEYIGGLERYRLNLRQIAKSGGFSEIMSVLRSNSFIDKELQEFYAQFDATFLDLFPDFVDELNSLLKPDRRIDYKSRSRILSTELRIVALIRLGVTDSVKIAKFLRRSVSTVYNYRVKMRNAALSDREEFEEQVMHIGMLS